MCADRPNVVRSFSFQSVHSLDQFWYFAQAGLPSQLITMILRRIPADERTVRYVAPHHRMARNRHARADRNVSSKCRHAADARSISDVRRSGQTRMSCDCDAASNAAVVTDLHEIIDLRAVTDSRCTGLRTIDTAVGADFDVVAENDRSDLRDLHPALIAEDVTETV